MLLIGHANVDVTPEASVSVLDGFPRADLAGGATPLLPAPRLSARLGAAVLLKRDDLTRTGLGGNKVRKLEFLLGAALADGCDTVVTFGALQSNHARQTAAACAALGLRCELVLTRAVPRTGAAFEEGGNVLLDHLFGATVTVVRNDDGAMAAAVAAVEERIAADGGRARWIPPGGSDAVGTLGYVAAGLELAQQLADAEVEAADVVVAVSTGGTHAGLLTGLRLGGSRARVRGVCVYRPLQRSTETVVGLVREVGALVGLDEADVAASCDAVDLDDSFLGEGYGLPSAGTLDAVRLVARTEGVALDPVYTGKAADALVAWTGEGRVGSDGAVVFVHTGGAPGLFAYPDLLGPG